jgi:tetratricopeptide (TPR) repeat protein
MTENPLGNIGYISIEDHAGARSARSAQLGDFELDPQILLPVEFRSDRDHWEPEEISWEAIVSAMLKILAYQPGHEHAEYYRRFVLAVKPAIKDELTQAGIIKARNHDFDIALEIFRALEGLFPDCAQTTLNLALVQEERARAYARSDREALREEACDQAFTTYLRALEKDPDLPDTHFNFAHFYLDQNNFAKAKDHFDVFLRLGGESAKIAEARRIRDELASWGETDRLFKEAFDFIRMGREEEGIESIQKFLRSHPSVWNAWFLLGWGQRKLARYGQARESFQQSLSLNENHTDSLNELAICLMELGELDESELTLKKALRLEPDNTKIISNLGILALKQGRTDEAESYFRAVLAEDENDRIAREYLERISSQK